MKLPSLPLPAKLLIGSSAITIAHLLLVGAKSYQSASNPVALITPKPNVPLHEQVLDIVRESDDVLLSELDVHPVSAVYNREAVVPPQCYTKTEGSFNPCYVCHQNNLPGRENLMNDRELQIDYSFSELGTKNHWKNLFEDRSEKMAQISDQEILDYISQDNYSDLAPRLEKAGFEGWIPDMKGLEKGAEAFDEIGFAKDGSQWVAFNYKPMPSTFWPTNGSTDDVMIRLPEAFRNTSDGAYSQDVYIANLAILEAAIKGKSRITCPSIDESAIGKDLNQDGKLSSVRVITALDSFVGAAQEVFFDTHLYPEGTEFMHTVRYVDIDENGQTGPSTRMKEVRYMKKWKLYSKQAYARRYQLEAFEKEVGNLPGYIRIGDWGLDNGTGWSLHSFIEDKQGQLRENTFEENFFCMGCHNTIGSTIDKTFSFARKIDGESGWGYIDLKGMPDAPNQGEEEGEILTYLERVGGGSEFRNNDEMFERWFTPDGTVDREKVKAAADVYELLSPSPERALALNKAYRVIVQDQDFIYGRDAILSPPSNVYPSIDNETTPTLPEDRTFTWNIVLDWESE